ncbi:murein biosynthesis integral membrane protein MurJ [Chitinimonas sp.]|uniref:murein biosynthesis integral membrane protein MurJ n=1 Tax=Chitinimonas sp. TaxID=1934313 RepID=UPI0035B4370C
MNLLKALARTSSMTMLSRILGFVRDAMNAHQFGASPAFDAFTVAFMLPNMLRRIFAEGAFSQAFVPLLAEYKTQRGDDSARAFVARVSGLLGIILLIITIIAVIASPWIVMLAASGFTKTPSKLDLAITLTRITFPYILLISLSSLAGSVLNCWNQFSVPAFTPTLLNISMIGFGVLLAPFTSQPIVALAISVVIGGVLQLAFQLPFLWKIGMLAWPKLDWRDDGVWRVLKLMGPAIFGVSIAPISVLLSRNFASHLPDGTMSWMYNADRLMELPTGVLGVALGTILLPSLSKLQTSGQRDEYSAMLDWGLRLTAILAVPATVALAVIGKPLVATLFLHGQYRAFDVLMTERALAAYAVGLLGLISIKVLAPAYYARQDIRTPVKIGIVTLLLTQLLNSLFFFFTPLAHAGLALAISLGACANAGLLFAGLRRTNTFIPQPGWGKFLLQLLFAVAAMALVLQIAQHLLGNWLTGGSTVRAFKLAVLVTAGACVYFAALYLQGFRPRSFMRRAV